MSKSEHSQNGGQSYSNERVRQGANEESLVQPINIVLGSDPRNLWGLAVTGRSILQATTRPCHIVVLSVNLSRDQKDRVLRSWEDCTEHKVEFVDVSESDLSRFRPTMYMRCTTSYIRYFVGELLPSDWTRCLWLDTDMMIRSDLSPLYDTPLGDSLLAAVPDVSIPKLSAMKDRLNTLGITDTSRYFNAGLLLIDLKRWRDEQVGDRLIDLSTRHYDLLDAQDQDALNAVCHNEVKLLDIKWNQSQYLPNILSNQGIIHLIGKAKPWHADYAFKFRSMFFDYLDDTAFAGGRPWNPLGIGAFLKRLERKVPTTTIVWGKLRRMVTRQAG